MGTLDLSLKKKNSDDTVENEEHLDQVIRTNITSERQVDILCL